MINVLFPPGCYGTFLTKCLYSLTNLNQQKDYCFEFDKFGSSHSHRRNKESRHVINCGHLETLDVNPSDKLVVILPCQNHKLDYLDNQFWKQENKQIVGYLHSMYNPNEIKVKLSQSWNYHDDLSTETPTWILREWCSFWINDCLNAGYDFLKYQKFDYATYITTNDIFEDLEDVIFVLAKKLELKVQVTGTQIREIQEKFKQSQLLHNIQKKCLVWVDNVIEKHNADSPCLTVFDEAFVQHLLRQNGYEIQCDQLNVFPKNSVDLNSIIYHV